jgi:UDP-N-acetyl-D-mannosaminuronic acid dehydrogenase
MFNKVISIIGLGYIGLPTAALLAKKGFKVKGFDLNKYAVKTINSGSIHIVEPGLDEYVSSAVSKGSLKAYNTLQSADIYIICVPTPFYPDTLPPKPNIDYVMKAAEDIADLLKDNDIVILESTSPVGTTELVADTFIKKGIDLSKIFISYCPERVLPGNIMEELVQNDRVIGGINKISADKVCNFYKTFVEGEILCTDSKTAEMCKLSENSFRDVNIAFANELSVLCDKENIDVWNLIRLTNRHPRVNILQPSPGVGGHCIAVDPWFIVDRDQKNSELIRKSRETNLKKTEWTIEKIKKEIHKVRETLDKNPSVAILGVSFKPNIDDLRESPSAYIAETLLKENYDIDVFEPNIESHSLFNIVLLSEFRNYDIVVGLVKHDEFMDSNFKQKLTKSRLLNFCGI